MSALESMASGRVGRVAGVTVLVADLSERKTESTASKMNSGSFAAHLRNKWWYRRCVCHASPGLVGCRSTNLPPSPLVCVCARSIAPLPVKSVAGVERREQDRNVEWVRGRTEGKSAGPRADWLRLDAGWNRSIAYERDAGEERKALQGDAEGLGVMYCPCR